MIDILKNQTHLYIDWETNMSNKETENSALLVGGFNPSEKYDRQNGNLPQIGLKIKKCLSCHHLDQVENSSFN